jgi:hypothetical protein
VKARANSLNGRMLLGYARDMRDLIAGLFAFGLLLVAASLATTLHFYRRRRQRFRDSQLAQGRTIVAEIPTSEDLVLFAEDDTHFHYGGQSIDKDTVTAVRVLINGSPIAAVVSRRAKADGPAPVTTFEDRPGGIARDRWDVAIETTSTAVLIECGAIRERVSQELARAVFDAVKRDIERRDRL